MTLGTPLAHLKFQVPLATVLYAQRSLRLMTFLHTRWSYCEPIQAKATKNQLFESYCGAESIRNLKPDRPLDEALINVLPGLLNSAEDSIYLGTKFYPKLLETGYGRTGKWIQGKPQEKGYWFFPVYDNENEDEDPSCVVVIVNWYKGWIEYYDPRCSNYLALKRRSEFFIQIQKWLTEISTVQRNWKLKPAKGPQQQSDDNRYDGDYILRFLCLCTVGAEVPSDLDVIATRRRFFEVISKASNAIKAG